MEVVLSMVDGSAKMACRKLLKAPRRNSMSEDQRQYVDRSILLPFSITGVSDVKLNTVMHGWTVRATGTSTAIACFVAMDTVLHKLLVKRQDVQFC